MGIFDDEGMEHANASDARRTAIQAARDIMAEDIKEGRLDLSARIDIADEDGNVIDSVAFVEAITIIPARNSN